MSHAQRCPVTSTACCCVGRFCHGVSGWVCNRGDGAVEAVLEGPPEDVDRVVRFCQTGPSQASVDSVDVSEESPEGLSGFSIR